MKGSSNKLVKKPGFIWHDAAVATADRIGADIILYQEPNKAMAARQGSIHDGRVDTAILCRNRSVGIRTHKTQDGFVMLDFGDTVMYNCYNSWRTKC